MTAIGSFKKSPAALAGLSYWNWGSEQFRLSWFWGKLGNFRAYWPAAGYPHLPACHPESAI